jgi:hypothetical protein
MVITPLKKDKLEDFFNKDAQNLLKYFLFKAIFSQPELVNNQSKIPIQVPKEHIEQWLVQCLGADPVGSGSYPVDIINLNKKYGADAKMLSWNGKKGSLSGETSLAQKFKDAGNDLDEAFRNRQFDGIVTDWSQLLKDKLLTVKRDYEKLEEIYYFFVIRQNSIFHVCGMEVDINKIKYIGVERTSSASIWIKNLIDPNFGESKIYKAKKRMELRLYPYKWIENNLVISFDNSTLNIENKELLGMDIDKLYSHSFYNFKKLFTTIIGDPKTDTFQDV